MTLGRHWTCQVWALVKQTTHNSLSHFLSEKEAETLKKPAHGPMVPHAAMNNFLGQTNMCKLREVLLSSLLLGKAFADF